MGTEEFHSYRIGLTGGIACGKSVVSTYFQAMGAPVIDADIIAREVVKPGSPLLAVIEKRFGSSCLNRNGTLNRRYLREVVFSDEQALADLNQIMQPAIRAEIIAGIRAVDAPYVIVVVPLLFENHLEGLFDRILVIDASEETQIKRTCQRDGVSPEIARSMLRKQVSRQVRRERADDLIDSDHCTLEELRQHVLNLHTEYLSLSSSAQ